MDDKKETSQAETKTDKGIKNLNFIRFLDEARWKLNCYYTPNYFDPKEMDSEQKLLTHFLGYITNRQTSYELIFMKLDFIFSHLVYDFMKNGKTPDDLLLTQQTESYFDEFNGRFVVKKAMDEKAVYGKYKQFLATTDDEGISATSRYFPNDFVAIYCALKILEERFEKSFFNYIEKCLEKAKHNNKNEMECLLYGLWLLGYSDIGQWKKDDKDNKNNKPVITDKEAIKKKAEYKCDCDKVNHFLQNGEVQKDFEKELFKSKRLICFVRDLLKCEHYRKLFSEKFSEEAKKLEKQLYVLELPGDVWNNNNVFRNCFLKDFPDDSKKSTDQFNQIARKLYKGLWEKGTVKKEDYYPEQLDATFDFVPRMCSKFVNCSSCPLHERSAGKIPDDLCIKELDENKCCPFLLHACGYKVSCKDIKSCPNKAAQ